MASPLSHTQWHQCSIKALGQDEEEAMVRFKYLDLTKVKQIPTEPDQTQQKAIGPNKTLQNPTEPNQTQQNQIEPNKTHQNPTNPIRTQHNMMIGSEHIIL